MSKVLLLIVVCVCVCVVCERTLVISGCCGKRREYLCVGKGSKTSERDKYRYTLSIDKECKDMPSFERVERDNKLRAKATHVIQYTHKHQ